MIQIAIDGTAASGKGTLGKSIAMRLELDYLDTGKLYRAVGYAILLAGKSADDMSVQDSAELASSLSLPILQEDELHSAEVAMQASKVAAIPEVRDALLQKQRDFANNPPSGKGAVLDGRDIGTIILPDAPIKFFVDAKPEVRATRRHMEMQARGKDLLYAEVLADLINRDNRDKNRTIAPLTAANDAFLIDSSALSAQEVLQIALDHISSLSVFNM